MVRDGFVRLLAPHISLKGTWYIAREIDGPNPVPPQASLAGVVARLDRERRGPQNIGGTLELVGPEAKMPPIPFTRREGRFRRYKQLNYLRCCRAANRSATVAFATVPTAAAIAAAMFGSSSAAFAPLNA